MNRFKAGDKVMHILSKDYLLVLGYELLGGEEVRSYAGGGCTENEAKVKCRTKDLREVWIYEWELEYIR